MRNFSIAIALVVATGLAASPPAFGQSVQLPTFRFFTVNTTVSVPDGGTALMGGVNSYAAGRDSAGVPMLGKVPFAGRPFGSRSIGSSMTASNVTATARIIILEEEEAKLGLTGSPSMPSDALSAVERRAGFLARNVARTSPPDVAAVVRRDAQPSAEEIQRRNALANQKRAQEATYFFDKGNHAFASGKENVAKIYYRMAATRADGELKDQILDRLYAVSNTDNTAARSR
jgi:Flp pilus assembly secretin CpaC